MQGFLNPSEVLKYLKLKDDITAVDFGSGSGHWVIPLAKKLPKAKVYAVDILAEPLAVLKSNIDSEEILNIQITQGNVENKEGSALPSDSVNLVLMTNLLFQSARKKEIFNEAKRVLKKRGKILVVDWQPDIPQGPASGRVSPKEIKEIAKKSGFKPEKEFAAGKFHYALLFKVQKS